MGARFPALPDGGDLERAVLARWEAADVPRRALAHREGAEPFVFFEGPPTANGKPAIHHVFSRTLKDAVCRYQAMRGHHVPRKAGWDTQGLPVEIEVQKQLGITTRDEIEALGIAEFNRLCRESVGRYLDEWVSLSKRMAYWLDYDDPYVTYAPEYIESCWAILARFHAAGLLQRDFKVLPYCPRCSTGLSNHELALGYEDVQDPSVFVRFRVTPDDWAAHVAAGGAELAAAAALPAGSAPNLLVWTTTPWTLFSNVAVAAGAELEYVLARHPEHGDETFLMAGSRLAAVLGDDAEVLARLPGSALRGLAYQRPLPDVELPDDETRAVASTVRLADFVSADDGTGFVHIAPAFGVDDFGLRNADGLPLLLPVDEQGRFTDAVPSLAGRFVKEADKDIIGRLKQEGTLFRRATVDHSYPHCWRCRSPLIYMARPSWYLRTTQLKDRLVALNRDIRWQPPEIGSGRFGEWLSNNVDWAISRERYWGTPLNVWVCEGCDAERAPASFEELFGDAPVPDDFDPHRPGIDALTMTCGCGGAMRRTPEVVDCWFDSGSMPFAQAGWPKATGGELPAHFPARFISEGLDQTRGWFYTLHVIAAFLADRPAYDSCLVNNLLLDADGKKMSKSRGNVVEPWALFDDVGADAARWFFVSQGQVWLPKRFDAKVVREAARRAFGTLENCYSFLAMYADLDGWAPGDDAPPPQRRPSIDRWLLSRVETLGRDVGQALDDLQLTEAARLIDAFVDAELSNWYVRRNRARFWKSGDDADKRAAFATLATALERVALLLAPLTPFLAEWLWCAVTGAGEADSVHLADWPAFDAGAVDADLERDMALVLGAVELGRSVRAAHDLRTRQPLARVLIRAARPDDALRLGSPDLSRLVAEELNVRAVELVETADFRELSAKPDFKRLGPRFGKGMKAVAAAVGRLDEAALEAYALSRSVDVEVDGETVTLAGDDIVLVETGRQGYAVAGDGRLVLALDTALDDDLLCEGRAREIVNRVQNTRKGSGLEVSDRVVVRLAGAPELLDAARTHEALILREVLGVRLEAWVEGEPEGAREFDVDGARLVVAVERAEAAPAG